MNWKRALATILALSLLLIPAGCGSKETGKEPQKAETSKTQAKTISLVIASCCVTEDVTTKELIPNFEKYWKDKTGEDVKIQASFAGSGTLTNQILGGDPKQVAILSSDLYAQNLQGKGLTGTDWKSFPNQGIVARSVIVFLVRQGNPKGIKTFEDLAKPGIQIIHSSPATSGGAQWSIYSIYGSALKMAEASGAKPDKEKAAELLKKVEANVIAMPESSKQAAAQFASGQGDVLVTYENEALLELEKGEKYEIVVPKATVETDWTVVKLDQNIAPDQQKVADGFIEFLFTESAQKSYAKFGFRSYKPEITAQYSKYAKVELPFNIDYLGGAKAARQTIIDDLWQKIQKK